MDEDQRNGASARRPVVLLALAVTVGIGLALLSRAIVPRTSQTLAPDAIARVNGVVIRREDFERALDSVAGDQRGRIDATQRKRVLDRLIDEELLVQHGLDSGVLRNARVRADLVAGVAGVVTAEFEDSQPEPAALAAFYASHRDRFIEPGRVRIRQIFFRVAALGDAAAAQARADACVARLRAGESFTALQEELGDPAPAPPPDTPLSSGELRDYLGPTVAHTVQSLPVDAVSDPIRSGTGFHVLQVVERLPDAAPPLEEIQDKVVAEYRSTKSEEALRGYLDDLRRQANIEVRGIASPPDRQPTP